jgi:hypothetical protein
MKCFRLRCRRKVANFTKLNFQKWLSGSNEEKWHRTLVNLTAIGFATLPPACRRGRVNLPEAGRQVKAKISWILVDQDYVGNWSGNFGIMEK